MKVDSLEELLALARRTLDACGLQDWEVGLDHARRRAGACHFDAPSLPAPWIGVCKAGHRIERFRTPTRVLACSKCSRDFRVENIFTWTYRGGAPRHHRAYLRELQKICKDH